MAEYRMHVVPTSREDPKLVYGQYFQPVRGRHGADTYLCGLCGIILMRDVYVREAAPTRIQCVNCGAVNES